MLTEVGRVVAVEKEVLWVETIRRSTCGTCAAEKGCGHGLMNKITDGRRSLVKVLPGEQSTAECQIDDEVEISIPEEVILRSSLIAYVMPLLCMLAGAVSALSIFPASPDASSALGAIGGLVTGFALVRLHAVRHARDPAFQPMLVKVLATKLPTELEPVRVI